MLIDLSCPIEAGMPVYPGDDPVKLEKCRNLEKDHYTAFYWQTGLHAGTHVDAPMHLLAGGHGINCMPLEHFFVRGVLLHDWLGLPETPIPEGAAVLIDMGTENKYGDDSYYTDHPQISDALCDYLIGRKISLLGVNAPSPDHAPFPVHKKLLAANIPVLENLMNLKALTGKKFRLMAFPLLISAEGSPVRAVAWIQDT